MNRLSSTLFIISAFCASFATCDSTFELRNNITLELLYTDPAELIKLMFCITEFAPCLSESHKAFQEHIQEALKTACEDCGNNERQVLYGGSYVIRAKAPHLWAYIKNIYNPNGVYDESFAKALGEYVENMNRLP